jgi:hypothetical protein
VRVPQLNRNGLKCPWKKYFHIHFEDKIPRHLYEDIFSRDILDPIRTNDEGTVFLPMKKDSVSMPYLFLHFYKRIIIPFCDIFDRQKTCEKYVVIKDIIFLYLNK